MTPVSAGEPVGAPEAAGRRRYWTVGAAAGAVMLLVFFWRPLLLGRAFYVYDLSMAYLPVQLENARLRAQGQFPLWNRYLFCGYPINAESESGGLYPPALVFNLPLSPERAYTGYIVFHYALAFGSVLLLGRYAGLGAVGATVAAAILTFGGTFVAQTVNLPLVTTFAWVPLILALQLRALQRGRYGPAVLAGVCLGVQLLGAHPQMVFYGGLMMVLLAWVRPGAGEGRTRFGFSARVLLVIMLVGLGIGAPQLFYNLELLRHSDRAGGVSYEFLTMLSFPPHYLGQLLVPDLLGREGNYVGTEGFEEQRLYLGLVTLGAVVLGWRALGRLGRFWRSVLVVSVVLACGHFAGVYRLLQYVPGFDMFRAPSRWLLPASLAAGFLAGAGLERLVRGEEAVRRQARFMPVVYLALAAALLVVGAGALRASTRPEAGSPGWLGQAWSALAEAGIQDRPNHVSSYDPERFAAMSAGALKDMGRASLRGGVLALLTAGWFQAARRRQSAVLVSLTLLVLLGVDLWRGQGHLHRFAGSDYYSRVNERIEMFRSDPGHFRIMPLVRRRLRDPQPDGLIRNFGSLYELEVLDGFPSVELTLMNRFVRGGMTPRQQNMAGAKYFQSPVPLGAPGLQELYHDEEWYVYRNPAVLPRVMLVSDYEVIPDEDELFARLKNPAFDPTRTVLLEREPEYISVGGPAGAAADAVRITRYEGQRVEIRAELSQPGIVVLHDFHYPGWGARSKAGDWSCQPLRVDGLFRGLALSAGVYDVVLVYRPKSFYAGLCLAAVTVLAVAAWGGVMLAQSGGRGNWTKRSRRGL